MTGERTEQLREFVSWVGRHLTGDEKGEAQIFLDRLFKAFGQGGVREAGGALETRVKKKDGGTSFADYVWKPIVLIEMKKRGEDLRKHYRQAFDYWTRLVPNRPRWTILCNFDEFWVYDFETQMDIPVDIVALADLPVRYGPLAFLFPGDEKPIFGNDHQAVTREAAACLADCFNKLIDRGVERSIAQRFILQTMVALFSQGIGLLEHYTVHKLLAECKKPADTYDLLGNLFEQMNTPGRTPGGRYKGVDYFNGGLFTKPAYVELNRVEFEALMQAAGYDWSKVRPEIFGTIFERSLDQSDRHAFGAHFTHPVDIMKIVGPTIVDPWRKEIEGATTIIKLQQLHYRMQTYRVLDPACGSGNFLYMAYRELKRIEARLFARIREISTGARTAAQRRLGFVTAQQFFGIDINPFAVELAKVTMMIARKLAIEELHVSEHSLPLDNLDANFIASDALIDSGERMLSWPKADVIIGNPPFLGAKLLKPGRGPKYVERLRSVYDDIPGMADYCVYWFRRAHDSLPECTAADPVSGRAGLVGTQNIRNNKSRVSGLDYIVDTGTIVDAVDLQPWSGEANVSVSIVNWVKSKDSNVVPEEKRLWFKVEPEPGLKKRRPRGSGSASKQYDLDLRMCAHINSTLSDGLDVTGAFRLSCNSGYCYTGQYPRYDGFLLDELTAEAMLGADARNREVVWPFLIGEEMLTSGYPERWVIDFQAMTILEAKAYKKPFSHVERECLPYIREKASVEREKTGKTTGQDQGWLKTWWRHFRYRPELIGKIGDLSRYVVCSRVGKRPVFMFVSSTVRPGDALSCFAFEDDYSFGILQSEAHANWFISKCSNLEERLRYTPESVFDTFPWPQSSTMAQINAVARAGRELRNLRERSRGQIEGGLRELYRTRELSGTNPLNEAHRALDAAVVSAYGFSPKKDISAQLLDLNLALQEALSSGEQVIAPGIPPKFYGKADLVTSDCIRARIDSRPETKRNSRSRQ